MHFKMYETNNNLFSYNLNVFYKEFFSSYDIYNKIIIEQPNAG